MSNWRAVLSWDLEKEPEISKELARAQEPVLRSTVRGGETRTEELYTILYKMSDGRFGVEFGNERGPYHGIELFEDVSDAHEKWQERVDRHSMNVEFDNAMDMEDEADNENARYRNAVGEPEDGPEGGPEDDFGADLGADFEDDPVNDLE